MEIAKRFPTYYIAEVVAEMVYAHRKTFQAKDGSLEGHLELLLAQLRAADTLLELSGDLQKHNMFVKGQVNALKGLLDAPAEKLAGTPPPA